MRAPPPEARSAAAARLDRGPARGCRARRAAPAVHNGPPGGADERGAVEPCGVAQGVPPCMCAGFCRGHHASAAPARASVG